MIRRSRSRLALAVLALALALGLGVGAPAEAGIRCTSYSYYACTIAFCCRFTCVYCYDEATGENLSEYCSADFCWDKTY
jgi:hypothetical protein